MVKQAKSRYGKTIGQKMFARSSRLYPAAAAAGTGDSGCEQRMESGKYAVITLFFAVLQIAENSCSSRKRLKMLEVRRNYRRSQLPIRKLTLLITLFSWESSIILSPILK